MSANIEAARVLLTVADKFESGKWVWITKNDPANRSRHPCFCADTAIDAAAGGSTSEVAMDAELLLAIVAVGKPAIDPLNRSVQIWQWNDTPGRTKEQVIAAFREAASLAERA